MACLEGLVMGRTVLNTGRAEWWSWRISASSMSAAAIGTQLLWRDHEAAPAARSLGRGHALEAVISCSACHLFNDCAESYWSWRHSRPASLTPSMEFVTPASTPCAQPHPFRHLPTTASAPNMSTGGDGMEDGSRGELSLRIRSRTADMSSSGSDLQGAVAAMAASVNATRPLVRGSYGGGEPSSSNAVPSVGCLRDEVMSCSVASFDKLPDVASEDLSESLPGAAGMLFTWGCDFSWMDGGKRDKHFGCLGLGDDIEGRLVPTRVRGDMDKHGVVQVACGWNMTIALSADGRVYQMGSTGAHTTDKNCTWEGAKVPTRVDGNLFGMFVEEVACGMRHVVAVASKVQANGQIPDDQRRIRLLAWGCGTEGQLGLWGNGASTDASVAVRASPTDHSLPQIVGSLDGRRVLHIAAGGNLTMAVMEHDSRTRRSNPGPSAMPTTTNHFGGSTTSTPSGGGAHSRALSVAQYQSVVGGFATGVRDASSAAAFQISQSLPITVAAAGLQSLQQMVSGGVGSRSKSGTPTAPPDVSFMPRRRPSRVVGIPQPTFGQPRSDTHHRHRSDLRRSTTRLLTSHQGFSGQVVQKALSSGGQEGKMLDATASASSGIVSQRSSPPLGQPSEDADSRSASPTSNSLYEISNVDGDFQPSRHVRSAVLETRTRSNSVDSAVNVASFTTVAAAAVANFARPLPRRGSSGNAADIQSLGDNSTGDTPETDTDSYAHGGRSLDMVPEQSEESPGSPSPISRHSHHAMTTAHSLPHHPMAATIAGGVAGSGGVHPHLHPYNMEAREVSTMAMQVKPPTSVKPRLSRLAQQGPAGTTGTAAVAAASTAMPDGSIGETVRSSVSTMDSSYTAEGSASSELSPSGIVTASPETPAGEMDSVHPAVAGMPALPLPFTLPEAPASPPGPQQHLPFASHLMALTPPSPQQHQQQQPTAISASPLPPAGPPSRHGSLGHVLSPQESLVRAQAAAGGAGAPTPGSFGRNRDAGANMWLQPPLAAAGGAGGHSSFRSEGSMRAYGMLPDSVVPAAVTGGHTAMDMPVGAGHRSAGSRGSRGHSRHASYDSVDLTSRDADGQHGNNAAVGGGGGGGGGGGFDPRAAVFPAYGGASASAPPRSATDSITANLLQQNEQLQKELEALRQQVALFKQAAGLASAGASGTGMLPAGGHAYSASNLSGPPPGQQQQVSAAAAAAAAAAAVAAAAVAVHSSPQAIAGGGGVQPHPGGAGPLPTSFLNDSASGHGAGSSGQPSFSPQGPARSAMLHHTHSAGMSTLPPVGASSPGNSFAAGQMTSRSPQPVDRQASIAGAPPPVSVPPPSHRHKRSSSIDVSSLIATRDGIGPAKEYLAPVPQPAPEPSLPPHHVGERMPSMGWEGTAVGSYTAQPALESLRHAHPGVSLAQTALEEFEECLEDGYEGEEDDDEPEEEGEPAVDESLGPSASIDGLGSVTLAVALPMASQGSLHRQLYVAQQQRPPQLPPPQQQLQSQQGPTNRPSAANAVYTHMSYIEDPHSDSVTSLKDVPVRPISETSYRSSGSGDGSSYTASAVEAPASGLAFPTAVQEADVSLTAAAASAAGGGGGGGPIWRTRRNAFVEWVNTMHHEMSEEVPNGGGGPGGNGGAVPGHGGGAGGAPSAEQLFPTGSSVPLAPVAETLPPEGMQFQYAPGVYITLKPPAQKGDRIQLVKVRFNRKVFTDPSQGQAWWSIHRAILSDLYHVTFDMVNKAPVALPQGLPPLAPGPHQPVPTAIMHVRGMSTDTQGTSAGSTAASASSSLYFSVPAGNSPVHGLAATGNGGCSGSGVPATVAAAVPLGDGRAMWIAGASALAGSGSGDLNANWTDVSYDDTAIMISPAPQPSLGGVGPSMPPRHHRSRSGSRTASGGSSHASASRLGQPQCPESPVLALQQVGTGGTYPGPGATVAAAAHLHHPSHQRTRSGGGTSSMS
ncbi:hypothetical protein Vretimale_2308 [Volvox reticuliferus]|nr:hypothetical protein Vretimale_2308 [Volvox reticuliferus]